MGRAAHLCNGQTHGLQAAGGAAVASAATMAAAGRSGIRLDLRGRGDASVDSGLPVLDRLLEQLARYARWDLALEVEPGTGEAEVAEAGTALGRARWQRRAPRSAVRSRMGCAAAAGTAPRR